MALGLRHRLPMLVAGLATVALVQAATGTRLAHGYLLSCFLFEFLAGLLLYRARALLAARLGGRHGLAAGAVALAGFGLIAGTVGHAPDTLTEPVRVALYGSVATLLVASAIGLEGGGGGRRVPTALRSVALRLGDTSYSIYLFHPALIGGCGGVLATLPDIGPVGLFGTALAASTIAVGYGVAIGTLVEQPVQARLAALTRRRGTADVASAPAE